MLNEEDIRDIPRDLYAVMRIEKSHHYQIVQIHLTTTEEKAKRTILPCMHKEVMYTL